MGDSSSGSPLELRQLKSPWIPLHSALSFLLQELIQKTGAPVAAAVNNPLRLAWEVFAGPTLIVVPKIWY